MKRNEKKFAKISDEARKQMEKDFYETIIKEFRKDKIEDNFYRYEVELQELKFVTYMTDEELRLSTKLTIDLLEEMKEINNNGMNRQRFGEVVAENKTQKDEVMQVLGVWNRISTDGMAKLFAEIETVRRIGGAWAMLIANPGLINAICAVYERLVDEFEDEELYWISGFFLLRAIMWMHSDKA